MRVIEYMILRLSNMFPKQRTYSLQIVLMLLGKTVLLFPYFIYSANSTFLPNHEILSFICRECLSWTKMVFTECKSFYYVRVEQMKFDVSFTENEIKFISVSFQPPMYKMHSKLRSKKVTKWLFSFLLITLTTK